MLYADGKRGLCVFGEALRIAVNEARLRLADVASFDPRAALGAARMRARDPVVDENERNPARECAAAFLDRARCHGTSPHPSVKIALTDWSRKKAGRFVTPVTLGWFQSLDRS